MTASRSSVLDSPDWSETRDDAHPIRWSPVNEDTAPAFVTVDEAARRLFNYGVGASIDDVAIELRAGSIFRTPFAFYELVEAVQS